MLSETFKVIETEEQIREVLNEQCGETIHAEIVGSGYSMILRGKITKLGNNYEIRNANLYMTVFVEDIVEMQVSKKKNSLGCYFFEIKINDK